MADQEVHVVGRAGTAAAPRSTARARGRRRCPSSDHARHPRQQPHQRQGPRDVPGQQHRDRAASGAAATTPTRRRARCERRRRRRARRHTSRASATTHRRATAGEPTRATTPSVSPDNASSSRRKKRDGREPSLVAGELEHPERWVCRLQERRRDDATDRGRQPRVRDERRAHPLPAGARRHAPARQQEQREPGRRLHERSASASTTTASRSRPAGAAGTPGRDDRARPGGRCGRSRRTGTGRPGSCRTRRPRTPRAPDAARRRRRRSRPRARGSPRIAIHRKTSTCAPGPSDRPHDERRETPVNSGP